MTEKIKAQRIYLYRPDLRYRTLLHLLAVMYRATRVEQPQTMQHTRSRLLTSKLLTSESAFWRSESLHQKTRTTICFQSSKSTTQLFLQGVTKSRSLILINTQPIDSSTLKWKQTQLKLTRCGPQVTNSIMRQEIVKRQMSLWTSKIFRRLWRQAVQQFQTLKRLLFAIHLWSQSIWWSLVMLLTDFIKLRLRLLWAFDSRNG